MKTSYGLTIISVMLVLFLNSCYGASNKQSLESWDNYSLVTYFTSRNGERECAPFVVRNKQNEDFFTLGDFRKIIEQGVKKRNSEKNIMANFNWAFNDGRWVLSTSLSDQSGTHKGLFKFMLITDNISGKKVVLIEEVAAANVATNMEWVQMDNKEVRRQFSGYANLKEREKN